MDTKLLSRLVERAQRGQDEAFAALYKEFARSVYYTALRITKNEQDAHDVVQETLLKLFKSLSSIQTPQALVAYVNKIAYNASMDILRKSGRMGAPDDFEDVLPTLKEENNDFLPAECLENKELSRRVFDMIGELGVDQRTALVLYYFQDLSTREISEITGVSELAVQKRLSRARALIKDKLGGCGLMGGVFAFMRDDVLSKLFETDAAQAFTDAASRQDWVSIATSLGMPAATIAATTSVALGTASSVISGSTAGLTGWVGTKLLAAAAAVVLVAGGATATMVPGPVHDYVQEYVNMEGSPLAFLQDIFPDVPPSAGIDISPITPIPPPPSAPPGGKANPSDGSDPSGHTPETPGATTPADPSASAEPSDPAQSPDATPVLPPTNPPRTPNTPDIPWIPTSSLKVFLLHNAVTYPTGSTVTEERLLKDLSVTAQAAIATVQLSMFDEIDFDAPGSYSVHVHVTDVDGNKLPARVAFVTITE